jgi:hypothetical protein
MNRKIATVNNVEIMLTGKHGEFIPVKPICEALGIAHQRQIQKIKEDENLSSVGNLTVTTGADGKNYEMFCLTPQGVIGWLFTINSKNINEASRENFIKFKKECLDVLEKHFFINPRFQNYKLEKELKIQSEIDEVRITYKTSGKRLKELEDIKKECRTLTMEEWIAEQNQLEMYFPDDNLNNEVMD